MKNNVKRWNVVMDGVHIDREGKERVRPSSIKMCDTEEEAEKILKKYLELGYKAKILKLNYSTKSFNWLGSHSQYE